MVVCEIPQVIGLDLATAFTVALRADGKEQARVFLQALQRALQIGGRGRVVDRVVEFANSSGILSLC